jgi:hypothetical protein
MIRFVVCLLVFLSSCAGVLVGAALLYAGAFHPDQFSGDVSLSGSVIGMIGFASLAFAAYVEMLR